MKLTTCIPLLVNIVKYIVDKSRVLKCFTDDDVDFCQMENGIDVPVMDFDPSDESDLEEFDTFESDSSLDISKLTAGFAARTTTEDFTGSLKETVNVTQTSKV